MIVVHGLPLNMGYIRNIPLSDNGVEGVSHADTNSNIHPFPDSWYFSSSLL